MTQASRPRSLEEMRQRLKHLITERSVKQGMAMQLRPTDVVITPYGKSGTTWTQQIVHTLRTRGDMDFDDISRVVPWLETSADLGLDLQAEQKAIPRAFKSHLGWGQVPHGGRYINVVRDPGDAAVSMFKFQEGWFLEPGAVTVDEFIKEEFLRTRNYYKHLRSWWPRRHDDDVLFLAYEHMLADPEKTITRIAEFIGVTLDDNLLAMTLEHSSIEFMLQHKDRFDDALLRARSEVVCDLPPGSDSAKVRVGKAGAKVTLASATRQMMVDAWQEEIGETLGFLDYPALVSAL